MNFIDFPRKPVIIEHLINLCFAILIASAILLRESLDSTGAGPREVPYPFSWGYSQPRAQTQVSHIADSLPSEPPGKSKNAGVGSLSLLQGYNSNPLQSSCIQVDPSLEIYLKPC